MPNRKDPRPKGNIHLPGIIWTLFLFFVVIFFIFVVFSTKMLPQMLLAIVVTGCLLSLLLTYILTRDFRRKLRFILGVLWGLLCVVLCAFSGYYVRQTQNTLLQVSAPEAEKANISFYVTAEDTARNLADAEDYTFGILESQDRGNTDETLTQVKKEENLQISTREYPGLTQLADGLLSSEVQGILINEAYLDLYEELEGYENFPDSLRRLQVQQVPQVVESTTPRQDSQNDSVINIYISGSDTRESSLPGLSRSDVNIIASVNTETGQILLLSTPRDYYVPLSISGGVPDKLTHAGIYGVQVSMDTLSSLYDIPLDYYFKINFTGFVDIIDALGGIQVESDYDFDAYGHHYTKGTNTLDGEAALGFCRERYSFTQGDRQRGKNQMAVIKGVIQKAASPSILSGYTDILDSVQDCMDTNIPYDLMAELVRRQLSENTSWKVTSYSVDGTGDYQVPYSMSSSVYVMVPDMSTVEQAKTLLRDTAGN